MDIGDKIGHYELKDLLGRGGFSQVFRAWDTLLENNVALKVLLPHCARNPDFVRRFHLGAKAAVRLNHPNIVRVLYMGQYDAENLPFVVMEYLPGGTLSHRLSGGAMSLDNAIPTFVKIADAVSFAHDNGLIHRDLKPENMLYNSDGEPIIIDFDLCRVVGEERSTSPETAMGTLRYISPEQARGEDVTPQSDVYSLGVMLFRMLTGEYPFKATDSWPLIQMHLKDIPPLPTDVNPALPRAVNAVIRKALEKIPKKRYASAREMADALVKAVPNYQANRVSIDENKARTQVARVRTVLVMQKGAFMGQRVSLEGPVFRIGYSKNDGNDFGLQDDFVSTHHGRFELTDSGWVYIDQSSRNGTYLIRSDGTRQKLVPGQPFPLTFGMVLELGDTLLKFDSAKASDTKN